jgi:hypothetical protein
MRAAARSKMRWWTGSKKCSGFIGQDRTQKLLFGFDIMRQHLDIGG